MNTVLASLIRFMHLCVQSRLRLENLSIETEEYEVITWFVQLTFLYQTLR